MEQIRMILALDILRHSTPITWVINTFLVKFWNNGISQDFLIFFVKLTYNLQSIAAYNRENPVAYECCNLTNFLSEIEIWKLLVKLTFFLFDKFFNWNRYLKITREIDLVLTIK